MEYSWGFFVFVLFEIIYETQQLGLEDQAVGLFSGWNGKIQGQVNNQSC